MRTINFFYLVILAIFLYSCNEKEEFIDGVSPMTRAIGVDNQGSISNPDLIWNWENISEILLNTEIITTGTSVTAPWADGPSTVLSETFRKDIKKEDGWKMLFHTFKRTGLNAKQNYMCFYNQYTGFIKIFYYYEGEQKHQGVQWYIKTTAGANTKILDEPTYLSRLISDPATNNMLLFSNMNDVPTTGIEHGWNGFEFQVPRYCTDLTSMDFKIGAYEKQITNYSLLGKEFLTTLGTITTTTQSSSGLSKALANIGGPEAKKFVDKLGSKFFGETVILGKNISSLISSIPGSGYISAFKSGLDMIFGKSTTTSTSDVKLTTTGTIELGGTSSVETTTGIPTLSFNLYEVLNFTTTRSNPNLVTASVSSSGHYLGVWSLKKKPVVYYDRVTMTTATCISTNMGGTEMTLSCSTRLPAIQYFDYEPMVNPDLEPYITKKTYTVKYVICDRMQGQDYKRSSHEIYDLLPKSTLFADSETVLREIPINTQYSFVASVNNLSPGQSYYNCFYDWGKIKDGRILAIISLDMTCSCNGKETEIYQSQVYEVDYDIVSNCIQPVNVHYPPYTIVVNYGYPYTERYGWDQNYR